MIHDWQKLTHEKVPLAGGMAGMCVCGYGCMMLKLMMMMTLNFNVNARR